MHCYHTRLSVRNAVDPPELVRMSAMVPVVLTRTGRRLARRMCMTSHNHVYTFYFKTTPDGRVTNVFHSSDGAKWQFDDGDLYPEFELFSRPGV